MATHSSWNQYEADRIAKPDVRLLWSGVNFINVLCTHFLYVSLFGRFSLVMFGFVIFGTKILYEKRAHKTLMKLMPGLTIIFILWINQKRTSIRFHCLAHHMNATFIFRHASLMQIRHEWNTVKAANLNRNAFVVWFRETKNE